MPEKYIRKAIALAKRAKGKTSPNPLVGAVIVKNGKVISTGYHKKAGQPHAEVNAINSAKKSLKGATLYINLEPCCHHGKTPPCTDAVVNAGIKEVYIGMLDPNPLVSGKGVANLRRHGIKVVAGILEDECKKLNEIFIKCITKKIPYVILKCAATLDGKTASESGDSKWITNEKSRAFVHKLRHEVDAILIGSGTLTKDNPRLTTRIEGKRTRNPVRVILDRTLKISKDANVLKKTNIGDTIIFCGKDASKKKSELLLKKRAVIVRIAEKDGHLDLRTVLKRLYKLGITSVLVEGGKDVHSSFVKKKLADKMYLFFAPKIMLGNKALPIFGGESKSLIKSAINVNLDNVKRFGDDLMVEFYF